MNSTEKTAEQAITSFFSRNAHISAAGSFLVAFSGGPDSTVLLHALQEWLGRRNGGSLTAAYVNHKLREKDDLLAEKEHVTAVCAELGVPLCILEAKEGEIAGISSAEAVGIEAAARKVRYSLLTECMQQRQCGYLVTAHTADDQTETMIMRFFQGSGPAGLKGIPDISGEGRILRPLLSLSKQDVYDYCRFYGLHYYTDYTNIEMRFLRNRIRALIPEIETVFPGFPSALANLREKMISVIDALSTTGTTDPFDQHIVWDAQEAMLSFSSSYFLSLDRYRRQQFLFSCWNRLRNKRQERLSYNAIRPALQLSPDTVTKTMAGKSGNGRVPIFEFGGTVLSAGENSFFWVDDVVHNRKNKYLKVVRGFTTKLTDKDTLVLHEVPFDKESSEVWLDRDVMETGWIVRSSGTGDMIESGGISKPVKKLFNEWKIPADVRWRIPILESQDGIAAVLGRAFGGKNRISDRVASLPKDDNDLLMVNVVITGSDGEHAK